VEAEVMGRTPTTAPTNTSPVAARPTSAYTTPLMVCEVPTNFTRSPMQTAVPSLDGME
jgi:hypothetical protein